jgi:hypothetical protein
MDLDLDLAAVPGSLEAPSNTPDEKPAAYILPFATL